LGFFRKSIARIHDSEQEVSDFFIVFRRELPREPEIGYPNFLKVERHSKLEVHNGILMAFLPSQDFYISEDGNDTRTGISLAYASISVIGIAVLTISPNDTY
jgi:hypothetical protein